MVAVPIAIVTIIVFGAQAALSNMGSGPLGGPDPMLEKGWPAMVGLVLELGATAVAIVVVVVGVPPIIEVVGVVAVVIVIVCEAQAGSGPPSGPDATLEHF